MTSGAPSKTRESPPPSVIADRYTVERTLGRGGMATVYLCADSKTGTKVAVKVLREELGSAVVVERFLREIAFASELDHPRIPKVLDSGVIGALPFYVMTYVEGESLRERLDRVKQLPVDEAVRIVQAVIEPMTYAHRVGIVHRDIKPGNILVGDESVYVLDFGIARAIIASADERLTSTGVAVGTPAYMSPEQALADGDLDARSDIYSLACVAYEMIAGIPPFVGATPQAVMARRFASAPPPLGETREGVPLHVERAVSRALCRAPADRWQTAREFADALSAPVNSESVQHVRHEVEGRRKNYGRLIAMTLGVVAIGAGSYAAIARRGDDVVRGQRAIASWDLDKAQRALSAAVSENPNRADAQLWLAHLLQARGAAAEQWAPYALRAADARASLTVDDRRVVDALVKSQQESPDCNAWREVVDQKGQTPATALATLAYANCLAVDRVVLADESSPTGYRFRSSHQAAATIYEGLLLRNAGVGGAYDAIMPYLLEVRASGKNRFRIGESLDDDPSTFVAYPSLAGDTLAFIPVRLGEATGSIKPRDAKALDRAVEKNLIVLREFGMRWIDASKNNPDAYEALALILESNGELTGASNPALTRIRTARELASRSADSTSASYMRELRLASTTVRLLLKSGQFAAAAALADSVLGWETHSLKAVDGRLADDMLLGLAALAGRRSRVMEIEKKYAAQYEIRLPSGLVQALPSEVGADAFRASDYALFGGAGDSVLAIAGRIATKLAGLVPAGQLGQFRSAVLSRPLALATPEIGPGPLAELGETADPFNNAAINLAARNLRKAKAYSDSLKMLHADNAPGEITMDAVLQEAWLLNAIGDKSAAASLIDNSLRGVSKMPANSLNDPVTAGALVRVMILRIRLANEAGDGSTAEAWSRAARALWGRGDPDIRALVSEEALKGG